MSAIEDIAAERQRQIDKEGWTPAHDDDHHDGALALAAGSYALVAGFSDNSRILWTGRDRDGRTPWPHWPWPHRFWKPKDRRSDLVRAGALIVAEIERLDRAAAKKAETGTLLAKDAR